MHRDATHTPPLSALAQRRLSRRSALAGGLATAAASFFGAAAPLEAAADPVVAGRGGKRRPLGFPAIQPSAADEVVLPPGYR